MEKLGLNEIREKFLSFFEEKDHLRLPSFPLVPQNDHSLLLINSGMAPLKPFFTGEKTPPRKRVTTCQKCIRTPDIERVGKTARHGTFFEMLGDFSFGDYFKNEIIPWAWEFCTETMKMPADRLHVTVYQDDDEAFEIWNKKIGLPVERISRMGKEDNFWEIGTGPCGPCSEIYFDRGEKYGCGSPDCKVGCECDRYVEIWNLVFTQFNCDAQGNYTPLEQKNIDTGMGLERLACIMQGVSNLFEVDTIRNIVEKVSQMAGVEYLVDAKTDVSLRVITDHIRSTTFMVCDGVLPSNEGRGYVLRKLLRRAARHGRLLGISDNFLYKVCDTVIEESKGAYPELWEKREYIKKVIQMEEEKFASTIDTGLSILNGYIEKVKEDKSKVLSGEDAFKIYDTYGFPLDLTKEIAEENEIAIDEDRFNKLMEEQKEKSRAARSALGDFGWSEDAELDLSAFDKTEFIGYETTVGDGKILAIMSKNESVVQANDGQNVLVVLDKTPFYGESGGQVGDMGEIIGKEGKFIVNNTIKTENGIFIHMAETAGVVKSGETVKAAVNEGRRAAICRAHSTTHLLQKALQQVLGGHVHQSGSLVEPDKLRFDFAHFAAMTPEEILAVETMVNDEILKGSTVTTTVMGIKEAKKTGAMALFNEKYSDQVRVVKMGDYSTELCGGTHIDNTAKAGMFKIISEASVASGIRRIEGVTGKEVLSFLRNKEILLNETAFVLKTTQGDIVKKAHQITGEVKGYIKEIESLNGRISQIELSGIMKDAKEIKGVKVVTAKLKGMTVDMLRTMGDEFKAQNADGIMVLASVSENKVNFVCVCGANAIKAGANAGKIVGSVAKIAGGGGGGRPDIALAGGKDASKLNEALDSVYSTVENSLK